MNKKKFITISIIILLALGIFFTICGVKGVFGKGLSQKESFRYVCDGFFVAGIVELGVAGIIWCSDLGAFDGIRYGVTSLFRLHFSTKKMDWKQKESFSDYKDRIHQNKNNSLTKYLAIIGGVFFVLSIVFLILYTNA